MNTFNKMWGVVTPAEAKAKIEEQKKEAGITDPQNLEEQAISLVGTDIYEKLIKGYTGKQWGRPCTELPAFIIKRLPVRFTYDDNYFNALYQGIPNGGYTAMVEKMLDGTEVRLNVDYLADRENLNALARRWSTPARWMPTLATGWVLCSTAACGLRPRCWTPTTIRQRGGQLYRCGNSLHPHHRAQAL